MTRRPRTTPPRDGFTLIEMLTVIAVMSVLMTIAAALLAKLMRLDAASEAESVALVDIAEFARRLRSDAAAADSARIEEDRLILSNSEGSIAYEARPDHAIRTAGETAMTLAHPRGQGTWAIPNPDSRRPLVEWTLAPDTESRGATAAIGWQLVVPIGGSANGGTR